MWSCLCLCGNSRLTGTSVPILTMLILWKCLFPSYLLHFISALLNDTWSHCMLVEGYIKHMSSHSSVHPKTVSAAALGNKAQWKISTCINAKITPLKVLFSIRCKAKMHQTSADRSTHEWPQVPHYPCVPYSLLIHTSQCNLHPPSAPPRQGQGAVVQVLAEYLIIPPSLLLRGRAACSGENLFGDRCAYQTPVLRPTPCGFHNYLLARLPRHSSKTELKPFWSL